MLGLHLIARPPQDRNGQTIPEMNAPSLFAMPMMMVFIFGFAKFYLLKQKLYHFQNHIFKMFGIKQIPIGFPTVRV